LKREMFEMIELHDQNKQEAIERREKALQLIFDDTKQIWSEEVLNDHQLKLLEVKTKYQKKMEIINESNEQLSKELQEVKENYLKVCEQLNKNEEQMLIDFEKKKKFYEEKLKEVQKRFENEEKRRIDWEEKFYDLQLEADHKIEEFKEENLKLNEQIRNEKIFQEQNKITKDELEKLKVERNEFEDQIKNLQKSFRKTLNINELKWKDVCQKSEEKLKEATKRCNEMEVEMNTKEQICRQKFKKDLKEKEEKFLKEREEVKIRIQGEYRKWKREKLEMKELNERKDKEFKEVCNQLNSLFISTLTAIKEKIFASIHENRKRTVKMLKEKFEQNRNK